MEQVINNGLISQVLGREISFNCKFNSLGLVNAVKPGTLSFIDDITFLNQLINNFNITGIFTSTSLQPSIKEKRPDIVLFVVEDPRFCFYSLQNKVAIETLTNLNFTSVISLNSHIHPTAFIASNRIKIGENVIVEPNVTIMEDVEIGNNCIIRAGSVIGSEGFEHKRTSKGLLSVVHDGKVIIGDKVEIGALNAISKGFSFRHTIIGDETRTDNLVHIAHGVQIGKRCLLPASCMIAGSVTISDDVWIGPNTSLSSGIKVGKNAFITIGSVVVRNVTDNQKVTGNFAIPHDKFLNNLKESLKK